MDQLIDVTTTAVLRPEIVERSMESFHRNLFAGHRCRLILHVDKVGSDTATVEDVHAVARKYFDDVVLLTQDKPDQNQALKRCWEMVETDLFFNVEDDWQLMIPIDLLDMIDIMRSNPKLAALRFPWRGSTETHCKIYWACSAANYYLWNGRYYERPKNGIPGRFGGLPSLLRTEWMRTILPLIQPGVAIEHLCARQAIKHHPLSADWEWGAYTKPNTRRTIVDIGTEWRRNAGYRRDSNRGPTTWVKQ